MPEGAEVLFEGEADESPDLPAGDVIVRIRSRRKEGGFVRKESNLYWQETLTVAEVSRFCVLLANNSLTLASPYRPFSASSGQSSVWTATKLCSHAPVSLNQVRVISSLRLLHLCSREP